LPRRCRRGLSPSRQPSQFEQSGDRGCRRNEEIEKAAAEYGGIASKLIAVRRILYTNGGGETMLAVISGSADLGISAGTGGVFGAFAKGAPVRWPDPAASRRRPARRDRVLDAPTG